MAVSQNFDLKKSPAFDRLHQFVSDVQSRPLKDLGPFAEFEVAIRKAVLEIGQEIIAAEMARYDETAPEIAVEDVLYRPNLRCFQTYMSSCGPVRIERQFYAPRGGVGRSICPLKERSGMVGGFWTPRAAYEGALLVADVPPGRSSELLHELSGMRPSKTSLDRLPKTLSAKWEDHRHEYEEILRQEVAIPQEAAAVGVPSGWSHGPDACRKRPGEAIGSGEIGERTGRVPRSWLPLGHSDPANTACQNPSL